MLSARLLFFSSLASALGGAGAARAENPCLSANFALPRLATETVAGCFESAATNGPVRYEVTFPAGYDPAEKQPFVIFLHGRGGSETQFRDFGGPDALNAHVKKGSAPFVVVAPGEPKHSYWKDGPAGEFGTAKMVSEDLVRHVEAMPGIAGGRAKRAIMGISMGGHGSFYIAEKHPELFSAVYSISPVFRAADDLLEEDVTAFGKAAQFEAQDPVGLYLNRVAGQEDPLPGVRSMVEIGKDDPFLVSSLRTKDFIRKLRSDFGPGRVNMSRPGGHDPDYWRGAFDRAVDFMGETFTVRGPANARPVKKNCAGTYGALGPAKFKP